MNTETHANLELDTSAVDAANEGEEYPEFVGPDEDVKLEYVATDGWRGYYNAVPIEGSRWEKVEDGWVTGDYDDAPTEARSSNVERKMNEYAEEQDRLGYDVLAVFVPTSNVFSTGWDLLRRKRQE